MNKIHEVTEKMLVFVFKLILLIIIALDSNRSYKNCFTLASNV